MTPIAEYVAIGSAVYGPTKRNGYGNPYLPLIAVFTPKYRAGMSWEEWRNTQLKAAAKARKYAERLNSGVLSR